MRVKPVLISFVLVMGLLQACTRQTASSKKVFNCNLDQALTSLDPAFARNQYAEWCDNLLYNGLTQLSDSLEVKPCIAKSWEVTPDGRLYTFHLRSDVFFHDDARFAGGKGRKVVASDFVYSFGRLIDPATASSGAWIFNNKIESKKSFTALNDSTFQVKLNKPFPPFLKLLTAQYCSVLPYEVVTFYGKDFRSHPVGTGPFAFKYWKEEEILVLLKNPHYFEREKGHQLPYLDAVRFSFIRDKQTAFLEFLKKKLDFFSNIDGSYRDDILTKTGHVQEKYKGKFVLASGPDLDTEYMGILVDSTKDIVKYSPLRIKKIRQAINYSIDRKKIVKYLQNSMGIPGTAGFIPQGMPGFDARKVKGYDFNPAKAQKLLAEAGYPHGQGMNTITLYTSTTYRDLIEFIQGELEIQGIHAILAVNPAASLREQISKSTINFFRGSWVADYPDAENYLSLFYSHNKVPFGPNYTGFSNPGFDKLFEKAYYEPNDSLRYLLNRQMDNLIMEQAPVVILYYAKLVNLRQNDIHDMTINPLNILNLKRVRKD